MIEKFIPYAKLALFGSVALGTSYMVLGALKPGGVSLPMPAAIQEILTTGGPDSALADEAVEIAIEKVTRIYSIQQRPPEGGRALAWTMDERFWLVQLDLGAQRQGIVCLVEPGGYGDRKLIHFTKWSGTPTEAVMARIAEQGMSKASRPDVRWSWEKEAGGAGGALGGEGGGSLDSILSLLPAS